jgi:glycosyltransferase involved in cell wall biosynthesis
MVDIVDASTGDAWVWSIVRRMIRGSQPFIVTRSHGLEHMVHDEVVRNRRVADTRPSRRYWLYHGSVRLWEVRCSLRHADLALFLSHAERRVAVARLRVSAERAHVVHNGISDGLVTLARGRLEPADPVRVALLGTFLDRKGIAYSVPALNEWLALEELGSVTLVGTGRPARDVLPRFTQEVRHRVRVVAHYDQRELPAILAGHSIAVLASLAEGFGKSLLEAMACGLAPIATDVSGPREFVHHEVNGLLIAPRDVAALVSALRTLSHDAVRLERFRTAARATAAGFGWDGLAAQRLSLYASGVASSRAARPRNRAAGRAPS